MGNNNNNDHLNEIMNRDIADSTPVATLQDLKRKTYVNDQTAYVIADAFTANPSRLLGRVIEIRKTNGACPKTLVNDSNLNFEFSPFSVTGFTIDEDTKSSKPELRGSIIADQALCAQAGFLNFLSGQLDQKSTFSLMIMDQAKGLIVQDDARNEAVGKWMEKYALKMQDPEICYIYVVTGFVQKNIMKKKYIQFEAGAKGGAYGVNINGKLSTSTEDYSLDIIFGLTPAVIKRPTQSKDFKPGIKRFKATDEEQILFAQASGKKLEI